MTADLWAALALGLVSLGFGIASLCRSYYMKGLIDGRSEVLAIALKHMEDKEVDG